MHAGIYYHSKNMWQPEVGDFRVHFSYAGKGGDLVSVVGRQSGREIRPYATEAGEELLFLYPGKDFFRNGWNTQFASILMGWRIKKKNQIHMKMVF